jgi:hypothetical protein
MDLTARSHRETLFPRFRNDMKRVMRQSTFGGEQINEVESDSFDGREEIVMSIMFSGLESEDDKWLVFNILRE